MNRHGDDLLDNRTDLAAACVTLEGGQVCVRGPVNPRSGREIVLKFDGGVDVRDGLRDVLYDLLTAVADEAQARFRVRGRHERNDGNGQYPPMDPDTFLGRGLSDAIIACRAKTDTSGPTAG